MSFEGLASDGYEIDIVVEGFPGKSVCHGGLGWSTIAMLRGQGRVVLVDVGTFGMRRLLLRHLSARGMKPGDVTDVLLTHSHHDHAINWTLFSDARIVIAGTELDWSLRQPWGETPVPELYMKELAGWPTLHRASDGEEVVPGIFARMTPGHTPGHLVYVLQGQDRDVVFTGDAAKNRAELLERRADLTYDPALSSASIETIWSWWRARPGSVLVPGHDLPMRLEDGRPLYLGERTAAIGAFYGETLADVTLFDLTLD